MIVFGNRQLSHLFYIFSVRSSSPYCQNYIQTEWEEYGNEDGGFFPRSSEKLAKIRLKSIGLMVGTVNPDENPCKLDVVTKSHFGDPRTDSSFTCNMDNLESVLKKDIENISVNW